LGDSIIKSTVQWLANVRAGGAGRAIHHSRTRLWKAIKRPSVVLVIEMSAREKPAGRPRAVEGQFAQKHIELRQRQPGRDLSVPFTAGNSRFR